MAVKDPRDDETEENVVVPLSARRAEEAAATDEDDGDAEVEMADRLPWPPLARRVQRTGNILSIALPLCWIIGWPLGTMTAGKVATGVWSFAPGYSLDVVIWAVTAAVLVRLVGFILALALRLEASAQKLASSSPTWEMAPAYGLRGDQLNDEIDHALSRLADAERLIRKQVEAIGSAGEALDAGTSRGAERLEKERNALIALTEEINREADRFAETIAERSTAAAAGDTDGVAEKLARTEKEFDSQLSRLEEVSAKSLDRFEQLAQIFETRGEELRRANTESSSHHETLTSRLEENAARIEAAQAELANQSAKLEALMADQRRRADRLAKAVTEQSARFNGSGAAEDAKAPSPTDEDESDNASSTTPSKMAVPDSPETATAHEPETPAPAMAKPGAQKPGTKALSPSGSRKQDKAWKDILAKVEEAKPTPLTAEEPTPPTPKPEPKPSAPVRTAEPDDMDVLDRLIVRIQNYSLVLQTQLFGGPSHEDLDRFESGERQIFAKALIAREPDMLRNKIKNELDENPVFRERTQEFLRDFDTILEPLSNETGGADAIQTYLTSPLGRLYMLTGSATGHFD